MIYVIVWLKIKESSNINRVRELLAEQARLSRAEPGCLRFEVYQSQPDSSRFLLCEHWESSQALDVHRTAHAYQTVYFPQVLPLVDREPHPSDLVG